MLQPARGPTRTRLWLARLAGELEALYRAAGPCHDLGHATRVACLAEHIAEGEGVVVDLAVAAALLHDAGHADAVDRGRDDHELRSARIAEELLTPLLAPDGRAAVVDAIEGRRFAKRDRVRSPLGQVLDDADNLDALGWIGISRVFLFAGEHGWPPAFDVGDYTVERLVERNQRALIEHWDEKLSLLADGMRTTTARMLAEPRHAAIADFLERLHAETDSLLTAGRHD